MFLTLISQKKVNTNMTSAKKKAVHRQNKERT